MFERVEVDELAALIIIVAGLVYSFKDFNNGWNMVVFGAGYLFGKGNPLRKRPTSGGIPQG